MVEDIRFVMSHTVVPMYVTHDRRDILRTWMKLLAFVQGMNPEKRETGVHIEEENENMHLPFVLGHSIANIHSLLVAGAFSVSSNEEAGAEQFSSTYAQDTDDQDSLRHAKVGRLSQESYVSSVSGRSGTLDGASKVTEVKSDVFLVPTSASCLIIECLRAIESWLGVDNTSSPFLSVLSPKFSNISGKKFIKRTLSKIKKGRHILDSNNTPFSIGNQISSSSGDLHTSLILEDARAMELDTEPSNVDDNSVEGEHINELEALHALSLSDWPDISYDVSSQDISVHIPLHRLLSLVLQRALRRCYGESPQTLTASHDSLSATYHDFFGHILGGCHPYGFSAFVMEHPLRIRVFCAEVHAGMWRKNGEAAILSCEWYRSVRWYVFSLKVNLLVCLMCNLRKKVPLCVQSPLDY